MPTYEYKCLRCNYRFEVFQPITAQPLTECPNCKGEIKRLISAGAGPIFKGSGFYQTDYKRSEEKSSSAKPAASKNDNVKKPPKNSSDNN